MSLTGDSSWSQSQPAIEPSDLECLQAEGVNLVPHVLYGHFGGEGVRSPTHLLTPFYRHQGGNAFISRVRDGW